MAKPAASAKTVSTVLRRRHKLGEQVIEGLLARHSQILAAGERFGSNAEWVAREILRADARN